MADKIYNVLFICTGNSARSILAESILTQLGHGRFNAYSAGSQPAGQVNPHALQTLAHLGFPIKGLRSKSWEEFARAEAPRMDFIFTVCDNAAGEVCPVWPGQPMSAHWGTPDPAAADEANKAEAFQKTALTLHRRIELMLALPIDKLDALALQDEVRQIGTR